MRPERSRAWAQATPRKRARGLRDLADLRSECTEAQRAVRAVSFSRAQRFIENAHPHGVRSPCRQTFQDRRRPPQLADARVDIEIFHGLAFI